jgi:hypothetical protein
MEQAKAIERDTPEYLRKAKIYGIPQLGSGRIFPLDIGELQCAPFSIPRHWPQIVGVDFGWDHPFAATRHAWDRDGDIFYLINEYRKREATPVIHAAAIKPWGTWIPVAWPHDGLQHDKGSGEALAAQFRHQGLKMLPDRATFEDGGSGVEAGVMEMLDRMQTGRWKVFSTCGAWCDEAESYHREDGQIVKERDDLLSASRYALMMKRHAIVEPADNYSEPLVSSYGAKL